MLNKLKSEQTSQTSQEQNQEQTSQTSQENTTNSNDGFVKLDLEDDTFDNWYQESKAADDIPDIEVEPTIEDSETTNSRNWFNSVFTDEDSPDAMDSELSDDMYSFSSDATMEITDMVFANINSRLHGEEISDHTANEENKRKVKRAWELYLRWKKSYVTPSWYLALTLFITYGMGTITGVYKWYKRYIVMGWTKAWSKAKGVFVSEEMEEEKHSSEHMKAMRKVREQPDVFTAKDVADDVTTISKLRSKSIIKENLNSSTNSTKNELRCMYSNDIIIPGKAAPKSSKTNPDLIGKFSSFSNYQKYRHENGFYAKK
tara:strand:- start:740 stop:1687 length:948 start_codon:yes stop_codon:yes gene_type:complete